MSELLTGIFIMVLVLIFFATLPGINNRDRY